MHLFQLTLGETIMADKVNTLFDEELSNLYEIARRAKNDNNAEQALRYYDKIMEKDPQSWEAYFYTTYFQSINCKIGEIEMAADRVRNCEKNVLLLVQKYTNSPQEILNEITTALLTISKLLFNATKSHYNEIELQIKSDYKPDYLNRSIATSNILFDYGDYVIEIFGDEYGLNIATPCWKEGIRQRQEIVSKLPMKNVDATQRCIKEYADKIKKYDAEYKLNGCYIATCVYGSYDCPEVWTLRRFRDNSLGTTCYGKLAIKLYYAISPTIIKLFGRTKWFNKFWEKTLNRLVNKLQNNGVLNTPYEDIDWTKNK